MNMFRDLTADEVAVFRADARANYKPLQPISGVWHPVYCDECVRINREYSLPLILEEEK